MPGSDLSVYDVEARMRILRPSDAGAGDALQVLRLRVAPEPLLAGQAVAGSGRILSTSRIAGRRSISGRRSFTYVSSARLGAIMKSAA